MPKAEISWRRVTQDGVRIQVYAQHVGRDWRFFTREFFEAAFGAGYLVTDYVFDRASESPRSFYVLTHGEATLDPTL